jgi:Sec-independent protein secretion pathway components
MFGIGLSEFLVIACVVIVFVRPRDLPRFFRKLGKMYAQVKKAYDELVSAKDQIVRDIEAEVDLEELAKTKPEAESLAGAENVSPNAPRERGDDVVSPNAPSPYPELAAASPRAGKPKREPKARPE